MALIINGKRYNECEFNDEDELESIVVQESKNIFGHKSIYINAKRKIGTQFLGGGVPDGFLFDFSDIDNPKFCLVEIELKSHDYNKHIHDQILKFISFYESRYHRGEFVNKLYDIIKNDSSLRNDFIQYSAAPEIYKSIVELIDNCRNIIIIIDGLTNIIRASIYSEWDKRADIVKCLVFKRFVLDSNIIYATFTPDNDIEPIHFANTSNPRSDKRVSRINNIKSESIGSKDTTKYLFKGQTYGKSRLVLAVVSDYVNTHRETTFDSLKKIFPDSLQGSPNGVFIHREQAMDIMKRTGHRRHFVDEDEILALSDNILIAVCTQWGAKHNIERFIEAARALGYDITESK
jgi:hypothetical protein